MTAEAVPAAAMDLSARELLDAELCSPQCLLARDHVGGVCQCRCAGKYHGALSAAPVMEQRDPRLPASAPRGDHPDWCDRNHSEPRPWSPEYDHHVEYLHQGPGHTQAGHRGTVARMCVKGDEVEVRVYQAQCLEHGWCTTPQIQISWTEQDGGWTPGWMQMHIWHARDVAEVLAVSGAGDSWLANALLRATEIFGPADADGNGWDVRDDLLKMNHWHLDDVHDGGECDC